MTVRTGTVNGLPCCAIFKDTNGQWWPGEDVTRSRPVGRQSGWMEGFPEWWPRRPTEQCPFCGMEKDPEKMGHVCDASDPMEAKAKKVQVIEINVNPGLSPEQKAAIQREVREAYGRRMGL